MQSPCTWGLEGAECPLLGSWLVKLFQVRGTRKAGLVMAFHERPIACVPRCVPLFGVHQTLDDSRTFRLLGTSPQCPYLGKIQNLLSDPQWLRQTTVRSLGAGGGELARAAGQRTWWPWATVACASRSARPAVEAACRRGPCSAWRGGGRPRAAPRTRSPRPPRPATPASAPSHRRKVSPSA